MLRPEPNMVNPPDPVSVEGIEPPGPKPRSYSPPQLNQYLPHTRTLPAGASWPVRRLAQDSNLRPPPSEGGALSN